MEIKKIAVLGAGLMGHGITQVAAQKAKYEVHMCDIKQEFIDNAIRMIKDSLKKFLKKGEIIDTELNHVLSRIHPFLDVKESVYDADLVIEAVPENLELKKRVIVEVEKHTRPETIIVSNTSSISITKLASIMCRPEKFAGMHFFNPPQLMKLVEIIRGAKTSDETVNTIVEVSIRMGKEPIIVRKDVAGFIVNRVLTLALNEAVSLVWEDVASPEDIDKAIKLGLNWPLGPLTLLDYVGVDTTLAICEVLQKELGPKYEPSPLLKAMLKANLLGKKTGKGFYDWKKKEHEKIGV